MPSCPPFLSPSLHWLGAVVELDQFGFQGEALRDCGHPMVLGWCSQAGGCPGGSSLSICQPRAVHPHPASVLGSHCNLSKTLLDVG